MEQVHVFTLDTLDPDTQMLFQFINRKEFVNIPHSHEFFEILFVIKGIYVHNINGIEQLLQAGSLALICPFDLHYYNLSENLDSQLVKIAVSAETMESLFNYLGARLELPKFLSPPSPHLALLSEFDRAVVKAKLERLTTISIHNKNQIKVQLRWIVTDFMTYFLSDYNSASKAAPLWFVSLIQEMQKRENFILGLCRMEVISNRSIGYISKFFRKYYETTPTDFINELRLNYCAYRLLYSDENIIDIALEAGFNNISHFYHLFKKKYSVSPLQYKNKSHRYSVAW